MSDPEGRKPPGKSTMFLQAQKVADEREAGRRKEDREIDARQEARIDAANAIALEQANKRAEDAKDELDRKDKNWKDALAGKDKMIRFQWIIIGVLILSVVGLAGYKVAGNLLGLGHVEIGGVEEVGPEHK